MDNDKIVDSIKNICKANGITVTKLEEILGFSQGLIGRWTKSEPSLSKIIDIANYFNVSLDRIVKSSYFTNDPFISKLISETEKGNLLWSNYNDEVKYNPKRYYIDKDMFKYYIGNSFIGYRRLFTPYETSFYTCIKSGYVSIYSLHEKDNTKKFAIISLFIQPDNNSKIINQGYTTEQLIPLWLKVLYSLGKCAPDDIKAEELKNAFISEETPFNNIF